MSQAVENAIKRYREFLDILEPTIDKYLAKTHRVPVSHIVRPLGERLGWEWPQVHYMVKLYLIDHPTLIQRKGCYGGIYRREKLSQLNARLSAQRLEEARKRGLPIHEPNEEPSDRSQAW